MARALVKFFDNPVLENKKTQEKIVIDFSRSTFCKTMEPVIRSLAAGNLGDIDKPDMAKGVRQQQQQLTRNFLN